MSRDTERGLGVNMFANAEAARMTVSPAPLPGASAPQVHERKGPVLLLAGPGTGKTYTLAQRVRHLVIERSVSPAEVTLITFTAAAAANMRARISDPASPLYIPSERQPETICTMHSLGYRIVLENCRALGLPDEVDVVTSDFGRRLLLQDAAQLVGLGRIAARPAEECRRLGSCEPSDSEKCRICAKYSQLLGACGGIDYDDQILLARRLLRQEPSVAQRWRARARHLLVDEYQDINHSQYELIRLLCQGQEEGLFAVGDDDQSIYSWRGGSPEFIRKFEEQFGPGAAVESLLHSYRCSRPVLEGALGVVKTHDPGRREKGEFSYQQTDGPRIAIHNVASEKSEAHEVLRQVRTAIPGRDVLVLVPTRAHGAATLQALRKAKVRFVAAEPLPGEGLLVLDRLGSWRRDADDSLALRDCIEAFLNTKAAGIPSARARKLDKLNEREAAYRAVADLWSPVIAGKMSLWESLTSQRNTGVLALVEHSFREIRDNAEDDVPGFLAKGAASLWPWKTVLAFLDEVENWTRRASPAGDTGSEVRVRIMTFQGSKGLEADVVCALGLEAGTLPRDGTAEGDLPEQARLLYVSMTRAKHELHLFHARNRSAAVSFQAIHGPDGPHVLKRSPFLNAIPPAFTEDVYHGPSA